ncbi:hypothetical protein BNNNBJKE_00014 [Aeromonas phage vB_AdhM_DL]|nr:hypothetical protein BNCALIDO_00068 [Aeromonas phage vB_AdhM_TS9]WBF79599.1 hypothetical protein BNNNBJKE_00014 [Aeromonas phage vB_AdhM_DL]
MKYLIETLKGFYDWLRYMIGPAEVVILLILAVLILTGCSVKPEPSVKVVTQEIKVPIYIPCIDKKDLPIRSDYVTIHIKKSDNPVVKVRKLDKLTQQQNGYIGVLEKVLNGCSE